MNINLPAKLRLALYILGGVGSLVVLYLQAKGFIGEEEVKLWTGLMVFTNGLAALNTPVGNK